MCSTQKFFMHDKKYGKKHLCYTKCNESVICISSSLIFLSPQHRKRSMLSVSVLLLYLFDVCTVHVYVYVYHIRFMVKLSLHMYLLPFQRTFTNDRCKYKPYTYNSNTVQVHNMQEIRLCHLTIYSLVTYISQRERERGRHFLNQTSLTYLRVH